LGTNAWSRVRNRVNPSACFSSERIMKRLMFAVLLFLSLTSFSTRADDTPPPFDFKPLDAVVGVPGALKDDVYSFIMPRGDLDVAVDAMSVPAAAGVSSQFYFFHCTCGKTRVVGQFCCADYEANDVLDAIRVGAIVHVASVGPMFISDRPRITLIRFQGEGDALALAKTLKAGLDWTGDKQKK